MKVSDYQLGTHNRCALRRSRNITTTQSKTDQYHKSVLIKKIVKDAMRERWDESRIQQELEKGFKTLCYPTEETAKIHKFNPFVCHRRKPTAFRRWEEPCVFAAS